MTDRSTCQRKWVRVDVQRVRAASVLGSARRLGVAPPSAADPQTIAIAVGAAVEGTYLLWVGLFG